MIGSQWIVLLGAPGCGKGTQSEFLARDFGVAVISVGDILRSNDKEFVAKCGKTVGEIITAGELLPDAVVLDLVRSELNKLNNVQQRSVLFDGFPRTVGQANGLAKLATEFGKRISTVLNFVVNEETITKRILGRCRCTTCGKIFNDFFLQPKEAGVCDVCGGKEFDRRTDDNEESLKKRLLEYYDKTGQLIGFYSEAGVLYDIDASLKFDEVKASLEEILSKKKEGV
jgi:adenylate kinase